MIGVVRRLLDIGLALIAVTVLLVGGAAVIAPHADSRVLAIRTGSMVPDLPVGSLVVSRSTAPHDLRVGDVVTVEARPGVLVTHRIERIVEQDDRRLFGLRGDANGAPDPVLIVPEQLVGRVEIVVPIAGFFLVMLATPIGAVGLVSTFLLMLAGIWLLEDLDSSADEAAPDEATTDGQRAGGPVAGPASRTANS